MLHPLDPLWQLVREDKRYKIHAYLFVNEALRFAQEELGMGREAPSEPNENEEEEDADDGRAHRHVSGQELCHAIRELAIRQFGYMAKTVLNNWGVYTTSDFGEIVYNMINIGLMRKAKEDRREDFDDVYDFEQVFCRDFQIRIPDEKEMPI
ncbi:MAG: hypothetical protein D6741_05810 [Planctomycetota bacterium]|nr:MAG: hypothetical protein D6741_05810 [Planctomycetota bacterium]